MTYLFADRNGFVIQAVDSGDKIDPIQSSPGMNRASALPSVVYCPGALPQAIDERSAFGAEKTGDIVDSSSAKGAILIKAWGIAPGLPWRAMLCHRPVRCRRDPSATTERRPPLWIVPRQDIQLALVRPISARVISEYSSKLRSNESPIGWGASRFSIKK